ncbi:uncharacterized protein F4807DRAFT_426281 [Annulohypoxylon truncatum]|uniref:uncharacterized protein n=1 Tax=Annulohypoxylon truncatum TaxID=327061 RepID=UPI002008597E|nr:uncharacterized protein F4807DRAFT_426281 [Annulohypoxylon truncatum]KAI1209782.1 hypothetical protein F4807DRAFT_426281 [Annulohypoxylon truncatum]
MHNATFLPHTSNSQQPPVTRAPSSYRQSTTIKPGLKRLSSTESLTSIGSRTTSKGPGTSKGAGFGASTRTGAKTRPTIITTTTATIAKTAITTTASSTPASSRAVLRRRDQNAGTVTGLPLKELGTGNMPYDAPSSPPPPSNANATRPQMPSLSAAAARAVNRNPLTPKIASKTQQAPTLTTPANRRQQHPTLVTASRETPSNRSVYVEDSSFAPLLNSNVTPRSGSRQNRVDSANSTPSGTPNPDRSEAWDPRSSFCLPSPRLDGDAMRRSGASFSSISPDAGGYGRNDAPHSSESKFFHASDVKTSRPTSSSKIVQAKGPTFFYANGNTIENNKPTSPTSFTPSLGHSQDNISSKFMYANGTPEMRHTPTPPISRSSGSAVSVAPKAPTSRPATNPPGASHALAQRPNSPAKLPSQVPQTSAKPNHAGRPQVLSTPQLGPSPGLRRSSTGTSRPGGHSRTGSLVKGDQFSSTPKLMSAHVSPEASPPITVPSTPAPLTLASIIQAAEDFAENEETETPDEIGSGLQSPTKSVHSTEPINELVANARRERKVQDLQITNASLEAINRTLERQLRKQTTELRRFRRLSRAGRLSLPSNMPSRTSLDAFSEHAIGTMDLSDLDEQSEVEKEEKERKEHEEDGEEESSLESDSASGSLSPSVVAEHDAKHRRRDEERLQVDLSKHQQLLIDSQKINQSIKRCLDWTEELISEGKKALEYHVRASDVELGGRVLVVDPLDDDDRPLTSDGSRDDTSSMLDEILDEKSLEGAGRLAGWNFERQDRDSGIELPADGG